MTVELDILGEGVGEPQGKTHDGGPECGAVGRGAARWETHLIGEYETLEDARRGDRAELAEYVQLNRHGEEQR